MIKKVVCILMLLFAPATSFSAARYYSYATGNDTSGDGTAGNPYKTLYTCSLYSSTGDECRAAVTPQTSLSGTLTFSNGSTTVSTTNDLTSELAAGDIIRADASYEAWWRVSSVSTTSVTLNYQYWGPSSGSAVTAKKITPVNITSREYMNTTRTGLTITGGWDLSTQTRVGYTAFSVGSSIDCMSLIGVNNTYAYYICTTSVAGAGYSLFDVGGIGLYCHDLYVADFGTSGIGVTAHLSNSLFEDIYISGGVGVAVRLQGSGTTVGTTIRRLYVYSPGTGSYDVAIGFGYGANIVGLLFDNISVYNSYDHLVSVSSGAAIRYVTFKDSTLYKVRNSGSHAISVLSIYDSGVLVDKLIFDGCTINATGGTNLLNGTAVSPVYFKNCTLTTGSGSMFSNYGGYHAFPTVTNAQSGSDTVMYFKSGTIIHDSSSDARSGKALKFSFTNYNYSQAAKVGTVKITNTESDITLGIYAKQSGLDGYVMLLVLKDGSPIKYAHISPTGSYAKYTITIPSSSLVANEQLDLFVVGNYNNTGTLWVDDFSVEQ